jgi:4-hydroxybenzoate polyprenyltransferase
MPEGRRSTWAAVAVAVRPRQWTKNVFVLAALVFAQKLAEPVATGRALLAFAIFCLLSSVVYLVNDMADRDADRRHPVKRRRPIAAGELSIGAASALAVALGVGALALALPLGRGFTAVASLYLLLQLAYSHGLKRVVILDVMVVAAGFLVRAWAGAVAIDVAMSHWLILCTALVALFLGFVKRRQEIVALGENSATRPILREYSLPFLDQMIGVVTAGTVLAYALYAFSPEVAEKLGTRHLGLTLPFVLFGIFRYLYLVHRRGEGENPTALVMSDPPLVVNVLLWAAAVLFVLHVWT